MIFEELNIRNYGIYKGEHIFNLRTAKDKNVVLIGGKNGTGKTTFLESIKLCLYGIFALGYSQRKYEEYIRRRIHKNSKRASISLYIKYATPEGVKNYRVVREWDISKRFNENFFLYEDNKPITSIRKEHWQDFIFNLIPIGVTDFFFFDGEKIEKLAEDMNEIEIREAIKNMLGFSLIERLNDYLELIKKRYTSKATNSENIEFRVAQIDEQLAKIEQELQLLALQSGNIKNSIDNIEQKKSNLEAKLLKEGGGIYKNKEYLEKELEDKKKAIQTIKLKIRDMFSHALSLAPAIPLIDNLIEQLEKEQEYRLYEVKCLIIEEKYKEVLRALKKRNIKHTLFLSDLKKIFKPPPKPNVKLIHNLPKSDFSEIITLKKLLKTKMIEEALKSFQDLERLEEEATEIELTLQKVPEIDAVKSMFEELTKTQQELYALSEELKTVHDKMSKLEAEKVKLEKEKEKLKEQLKKAEKVDRTIVLISSTQELITRFKTKFLNRKLSILEREILNSFNKIAYKNDLIKFVFIDKNSFEIKLVDREGKDIHIDNLSAGERQILAISLLWGMSKLVRKRLPMVIDTPLSRLDKEHRINIVKNFLPQASHQVVVLSTDEEIYGDMYRYLEPHIAKEYTLVYDHHTQSTMIVNGYLWKSLARLIDEV